MGVNRGRGLIRCHSVTTRLAWLGPFRRPQMTSGSPATTGFSETLIETLWRPFGLGCFLASAAAGDSSIAQAIRAAQSAPTLRFRMGLAPPCRDRNCVDYNPRAGQKMR